jgi:hypothetical protein
MREAVYSTAEEVAEKVILKPRDVSAGAETGHILSGLRRD